LSSNASTGSRKRPAGPEILTDLPRKTPIQHGFRHWFADKVLRATGWTPEGDPPDTARYVIIAAPHTAWMDGFWMNAFAWYWGVDIKWFIKDSAAVGPFRWFLLSIGAIPVDRSTPNGMVGHIVSQLRDQAELVVSVPAEGTRAKKDFWRSGFYHIARQADVPVCMSYLDYGNKKGGFGPTIKLSGNVRADMETIRAFYRDMQGKYPEKFTTPRLREEDQPEAAAAETALEAQAG
jgi:1-acyl-sn-glycerol-3-phosphate acyltransferase